MSICTVSLVIICTLPYVCTVYAEVFKGLILFVEGKNFHCLYFADHHIGPLIHYFFLVVFSKYTVESANFTSLEISTYAVLFLQSDHDKIFACVGYHIRTYVHGIFEGCKIFVNFAVSLQEMKVYSLRKAVAQGNIIFNYVDE